MPAHKDISGSEFNGVLILRVSHKNARSVHYYACRCHCGTEFVAEGDKVKRGHTRSCGCMSESRKHGMVSASEYGIWAAMKRRCLNENSPAYPDYGGRGITVCERWMDFRNFYNDMGDRPSEEHEIDRRDNSKGYSPDNCYWATVPEQSRNRRSNVILEFQGESLCLTDWAHRKGMKRATLEARLKKGWDIGRALTTPVRPMRLRS